MAKAVSLPQEKKLSTKNKKSARAIALATLIRVLQDGSYSNISLNNSLQGAHLSQADKNLATKLVYGTIQYRIFLDYQLHDLIKTKLSEKYLKPLLLMSAYQIFFLDKIPTRAVLDEANKLAKEFGKQHSGGFRVANGILRALTRRGKILPPEKDRFKYLSVKESIPIWLVKYFVTNWGFKRTASILQSINEPAKNSVRLSSLTNQRQTLVALTKLGYEPQASQLAANNYVLAHGGIVETTLFKNGQLTVQDEAASLVVDAFDFNGDEEVLDACSAPGGKTVQIAEHLTTGQVTALDIHEKKLRLVRQNATRMHVADQVKTKAIDARKADEYFSGQQFARILVDAPCSGLGLLRRKPEIRYTKKKQDLLNLQKIQLSILDHVSHLLEENGELVYSTCTISLEEDEDVVKQFLASHPNFELVPFELSKIGTKTGMLKILPDSYGSDGFFIAKFKLRG
ncbi:MULTISPECIES: 16S rRNA (cytosine(967)-C(5))-methyltransferase RsmB [Lactobacillus]|uniref:16S rRNA (cytosine(967)-C(5))-methyltransferase n=1 Tax=Lactobacillus xujianguonis TaxID=2495899 RepID=A0A437SXK4_9LACO|nr:MULTISPECIES: 16S rRNA (cytosine(967)-C(5))-methyltransferase RsmB [Lactobacillus]RVU71649.1 16S rRNA (cytosine(967)-C(5))-methyltransferase RsmB [Lactobacillus xujianguonis]RVU77700.1 16S rRNA (cytosine(967)-C(5))-methyltransferase RsmB [Lactobacillus xujianguonis]